MAIFKLGEIYEKTGQIAKAVQQYRLVVEKVPKADHVVVALADLYLKMKNYDEAIRWHREVVKRQPKNAAAYANLACLMVSRVIRKRKSRIIKKRSS